MSNKIDIHAVKKVSLLAKLEIEESEIKEMADRMNEIVNFVKKIDELDTENVEESIHAVKLKNVLREDNVEDGLTKEQVLKLAPKTSGDYIVVPKVLS